MANAYTEDNERQRILRLSSWMRNDRAPFDPHWRQIADVTFPRRVRFTETDRNRTGPDRFAKIIHERGTYAARTLRSGMMSGLTSPARPWRRITTADTELAEFGSMKEWLFQANKVLTTFNGRSNFNKVAPTLYGDLGLFGSPAVACLPDEQVPYRYYSFPIGSFWLACNHRGIVDTFMRQFQKTVRQVVMEFGDAQQPERTKWDNFSPYVKDAFERSDYEKPVTLIQWIGYNPNFKPGALNPIFKRFSSCYFEMMGAQLAPGQQTDAGVGNNTFLRRSGFDLFPILAPRWDITGEDTYATSCPGMETLGSINELQTLWKKKSKGLDKQLDPPLTGPMALRNQKVSLLSGDITYGDAREGTLGLRPIHQTQFSHADVIADIHDLESRIREGFYTDLFQMMAQMEGVQPRNEKELAMRQEEKLLELGPVVEAVSDEFLNPDTDLEIHYLNQVGLIPPLPKEGQGKPLKVEYVSLMAQAQKLVGVAGQERFLSFVGSLVGMYPEVRYKVNAFAAVNDYGDMMGVPANILVEDDQAQAKVDAEMQAKQQAAQAQMAGNAADAAKQLSETDMSTDNMLTRVMAGA